MLLVLIIIFGMVIFFWMGKALLFQLMEVLEIAGERLGIKVPLPLECALYSAFIGAACVFLYLMFSFGGGTIVSYDCGATYNIVCKDEYYRNALWIALLMGGLPGFVLGWRAGRHE